jgi:hypothetical protein
MAELVGRAPAKRAETEVKGSGKGPRGRLALELVALRGKDVIGVRHLVDGGSAWVGDAAHALARVPARELGGPSLLVGEVRAGTYAVEVPPRARARMHGSDGIPRILVGPRRLELREGERAVVVLGAVQIRAQVVPFEAAPGTFKLPTGLAAWLALAALLYAGALAFATAMAPPTPPRLERGALRRIHGALLPSMTQVDLR